jgi:hypothetical protein
LRLTFVPGKKTAVSVWDYTTGFGERWQPFLGCLEYAATQFLLRHNYIPTEVGRQLWRSIESGIMSAVDTEKAGRGRTELTRASGV